MSSYIPCIAAGAVLLSVWIGLVIWFSDPGGIGEGLLYGTLVTVLGAGLVYGIAIYAMYGGDLVNGSSEWRGGQVISEVVDSSTVLMSVASEDAPDGSTAYTAVAEDGTESTYSTKLGGFEVRDAQGSPERIEQVTVVTDAPWTGQRSLHVTRLYVEGAAQ